MPHGLSVFCRSGLLSLIVSVTLPPPHLLLQLHCLMSDHPTACSFFRLLLGRRSLLPILCGGAQHSVLGSRLGPVNTPPGDLSLPLLRVSSTPSPLVQILLAVSTHLCGAQFSSVAPSCPGACHPMDCSTPGLPITNSRSLLKLMSIELVRPSNHLILCRPLLLPPSVFPSIRVFSKESALCIRWPTYWCFSFDISPSNERSGGAQ